MSERSKYWADPTRFFQSVVKDLGIDGVDPSAVAGRVDFGPEESWLFTDSVDGDGKRIGQKLNIHPGVAKLLIDRGVLPIKRTQ
jgi:hypothetical protein